MNIGISHQVIKDIKFLKKNSDKELVVIEDLSIFDFLMKDNKNLEVFVYCPSIFNKESTIKIKDYFINNSKEVYEISEKVYYALVDKANQAGLIGIYKDKLLKISDLDFSKINFVTVIDKLETPGNIGTIFRSCDGCNVDLVIIVDEVAKVNSYKVTQASRGMSLFIKKLFLTYESAQELLLKHNFNIYLGEPILGLDYQKYDYKDKIAIVIGNERYGINAKWYEKPNIKVFVPMKGKMTSLNVSIAASLIIYEAFMKRNRF